VGSQTPISGKIATCYCLFLEAIPVMKTRFLLLAVCVSVPSVAPRQCLGGVVAAWGDDSWGQTSLPAGVDNVKAISAGWRHSLALKADGTVLEWGYNGCVLGVPEGLSNVIAVSAGGGWSVALKDDHTAVAWQCGDIDQSTGWHLSGESDIVAISAGWYHWIAIKSDSTIATYGDGNDSYTPSNPKNIPGGLSNIVAVSAGLEMSLALKSDGTVVAWGWNAYGQTNVPPGLSNVIAIATSSVAGHCLALRADGTVVAWGANWAGQTDVPAGLSNVVAIAAGAEHSLALQADGTVVAWGDTTGPQYGQAIVPAGVSNVMEISAGEEHSLALVFSGPVQITQNPQPANQIVPAGSNVTYSVNATGAGTLSYQWRRNGQAFPNSSRVSGVNSATLQITDLQAGDSGTYTVIVSNALGSVQSGSAILSVAMANIRPQLSSPQLLRDGSFVFSSSTMAGAGFTSNDLPGIEIQTSTDFINWKTVPSALSISNGNLQIQGVFASNLPMQFYRIAEPGN
jgi:Immunoglobulin I-set domain/Regulator of chromosome condensation (RCC1) repeat